MCKARKEGILYLEYAYLRKSKKDLRYRLRRRGDEVLRVINKYHPRPEKILDLGTAEGKMLNRIKLQHKNTLCIGVDYSWQLLKYGIKQFPQLYFIYSDVQRLSFLRGGNFDIIVSTATIEHLSHPQKMLSESARLLKNNGIIIITTPHPFWEKISSTLGLLKSDHQSVIHAKTIRDLCLNTGLKVIEYKGFMLSPIGIKGELTIEKGLRRIGIDKFLPNQLIVAQKL